MGQEQISGGLEKQNWYAAFDILRVYDNGLVADLIDKFPEYRDELAGERILGSTRSKVPNISNRHAELARAAAQAMSRAVTSSLDEVLIGLAKRVRNLARVRLISGVIAILGSTAVLAAISQDAHFTRQVGAIITILATSLGLIASYLEDQSGGAGSVGQMRECMFEQLKLLSELKGKMLLDSFVRDDETVLSVMSGFNSISAQVQVARARLGLTVSS